MEVAGLSSFCYQITAIFICEVFPLCLHLSEWCLAWCNQTAWETVVIWCSPYKLFYQCIQISFKIYEMVTPWMIFGIESNILHNLCNYKNAIDMSCIQTAHQLRSSVAEPDLHSGPWMCSGHQESHPCDWPLHTGHRLLVVHCLDPPWYMGLSPGLYQNAYDL